MKQQENLLSAIEVEPERAAKHTVIWLHGLGADGSDFVPFIPALRLPANLAVRFIFPSAPVLPITINNGYEMRAWYDIVKVSLNSHHDEVNIRKSGKMVANFIEKEIARGIAAKNIILGGFSQGAVMALLTGLSYPVRLGGIMALSGYLPPLEIMTETERAANKKTPIFLAHGQQDFIVPYALGTAAYAYLRESQHSVTWHSYFMQHAVCPQEIEDIREWIMNVWK